MITLDLMLVRYIRGGFRPSMKGKLMEKEKLGVEGHDGGAAPEIAELTLEIRNLAHRGWEDRPNARYLFREIGKRAQQIAELAAGAAPEQAKESLRKALLGHWLSSIECNHYERNDSAICVCGWKSDRGFNVGKAVEFWIDHVFEKAELRESRPLPSPEESE